MKSISEVRAVKWEDSNAVGFGLDFKLSDLARKFLLQHGPRAFAEKYGTHFIFAVIYGGTMVCTLNIETKSRQQKTQLLTDMSAKAEAIGKGKSPGAVTRQMGVALQRHYRARWPDGCLGA